MDLQKEISALSPDRRQLLALLLLESDGNRAALPSAIRRRHVASVEVSFAQQRLWFLHKLNPWKATYNTPAALKITGDLNVEILEKVFTFLVARHEALRLVFREEKGRIYQLVREPFAVGIELVNLSASSAAENASQAEKLLLKDIETPFDLEGGPLFRVHLYKLGDKENILLLNMHHIISDGWSLGVIIKELALLYRSFLLGDSPSLPGLEIQYPDFADWERKMVETPAWRAQLEFWKKTLSEPVESLKFPAALKANGNSRESVETSSILLRAPLVGEIRHVCAVEHYTLYTFLLTAFQVLLYHYTGQKKFVIGSPVANRCRAETEDLIGCFINPLAIRARLDGNLSFGELLTENRRTVLDAFDNQEIPFEIVLDSIRRARNEPQNRLFNVWFVLQNAPLSEFELPGLKFANYKIPRIASQFDIAMNINETGEEIHCAIDYSARLFAAADIRRMLEHFHNILLAAAGSREVKLREIALKENQPAHLPPAKHDFGEDDFDF
jgi:hypothetical protein